MPTELEKCENCGRSIGKLETPQVWRDAVVCAECHGRLQGNVPKPKEVRRSRWSLLLAPLLILLTVSAVALAIFGRSKANLAASIAEDAAKLRTENDGLRKELETKNVDAAKAKAALAGLQGAAAGLQAENQKLTGTVAELRASPKPAPQPIKAEITGAVWLTRNNASSDIQRGIAVRLLPPIMAGGDLSKALEQARQENIAWAVDMRKTLEVAVKGRDDLKTIASGNDDPRIKDGFDELEKKITTAREKAAQLDRNAAQIITMIQQMPATVRVDYAYTSIKTLRDGLPYFSPTAETIAIQSMPTTVEGKYTLTNVPQGSYFLYAVVKTDTVFADWLIPVTVAATGRLNQDLFNANASTIKSQ